MTRIRPCLFLLAVLLPAARQQDDEKPLQRKRPAKKEWRAADGAVFRLDRAARGGAVVDGDTVHLDGQKGSLRLAGVDSEEVFHSEADRKAAEQDFAAYATAKRGKEPRPVKYGTPAGEAAKEFASRHFEKIEQVLYIPDDPDMPTEYYGRNLGHLLADRNGDGVFEENFAVELVRNGHSPYFVKYGTSWLFHAEFLAAEVEARREKRGIWSADPTAPKHYPDYEERLAWWHRRAKVLDLFESKHAEDGGFYRIQYAAEFERLKRKAGKEPGAVVTVFGVLSPRTEKSEKQILAYVAYRNRCDVPILWTAEGAPPELTEIMGEYVYVKGTVHPSKAKAGIEIRVGERAAIAAE